jgi:hypothetical protein
MSGPSRSLLAIVSSPRLACGMAFFHRLRLADRINNLQIGSWLLRGTGRAVSSAMSGIPARKAPSHAVPRAIPDLHIRRSVRPDLRDAWVSWEEVLTRAGLNATERNDRAFLVTAEEYLRLWNAMMDLSGQQDVSKLLGLRMAGGPAIPVLFALSTAPDFETGITRMAQFKSLFRADAIRRVAQRVRVHRARDR